MSEILSIIEQQVSQFKQNTDFENREKLAGFGISCAMFVRKFYPVGSDEYAHYYKTLFDKLSPIYQKAKDGIKSFSVDIEYSTKNGKFGYLGTFEERTEEEVRERLKHKQFKDLATGRVIKAPKFTKFEISLKPQP